MCIWKKMMDNENEFMIFFGGVCGGAGLFRWNIWKEREEEVELYLFIKNDNIEMKLLVAGQRINCIFLFGIFVIRVRSRSTTFYSKVNEPHRRWIHIVMPLDFRFFCFGFPEVQHQIGENSWINSKKNTHTEQNTHEYLGW